jgi:hypothetical protein
VLAVDHLDAGQRVVGRKRGARQRGAAAAVDRLGIGEIKDVVLREVAVEDDVEQAALAAGENRRHAGERLRQRAVARDDAQAAGSFGHQHAAVGQKGERPGMHQPARHGFDPHGAGRGLKRRVGRAGRRGGDERDGDSEDEAQHGVLHRRQR